MRGVRAALVAGWLLVCGAVALADLRNPAWDWVELPFSRYVHADSGWLIRVAVLGGAVLAVLAMVALRPVWLRRRSVLVLLGIALVALLVAGTVSADPPGHHTHPSTTEIIHGVAGWFCFLTFPPVAILTALTVQRFRGLLWVLALASTALTVFIVVIWAKQFESIRSFPWGPHDSVLGLVERALFFVDTLTLAVAGHAAGSVEPTVARPGVSRVPDRRWRER